MSDWKIITGDLLHVRERLRYIEGLKWLMDVTMDIWMNRRRVKTLQNWRILNKRQDTIVLDSPTTALIFFYLFRVLNSQYKQP